MRPKISDLLLMASTFALAAPLAAQSQPRVFSLPEPTPAPSERPQVEGPVDDTGIVPVGPRVIRTPAPNATPSPAPSIAAEPVLTPNSQMAAEALPSQPVAPGTSRRPATNQQAAPATVEQSIAQASDASVAEPSALDEMFSTSSVPTEERTEGSTLAEAATDAAEEQSLIPWWAWPIAGFLTLLLALMTWLWRKARKPKVYTIQPPKPLDSTKPLPGDASIEVDVAIHSASRSVMMFNLDFSVSIQNRGMKGVRDIEISAQLSCAQNAPAGRTAAIGSANIPAIERIGPGQSLRVAGKITAPNNQLAVVRQGNTPVLIPLLDVTVTPRGADPIHHQYVIGLPSQIGTTRLQPIPINSTVGSIPGLGLRRIEASAA